MKAMRTYLLLTVLLALLAAAPALAVDDGLQGFYDGLVADGVLAGSETLDALGSVQTFEEVTITGYALAGYLAADTVADADSFTYRLFIAQADIPDDLSADGLFARFIHACAPDAVTGEEAAALVDWLRTYSARTSQYGRGASRDIDGFTVSLCTSLTDSEEYISLVRYLDTL